MVFVCLFICLQRVCVLLPFPLVYFTSCFISQYSCSLVTSSSFTSAFQTPGLCLLIATHVLFVCHRIPPEHNQPSFLYLLSEYCCLGVLGSLVPNFSVFCSFKYRNNCSDVVVHSVLFLRSC